MFHDISNIQSEISMLSSRVQAQRFGLCIACIVWWDLSAKRVFLKLRCSSDTSCLSTPVPDTFQPDGGQLNSAPQKWLIACRERSKREIISAPARHLSMRQDGVAIRIPAEDFRFSTERELKRAYDEHRDKIVAATKALLETSDLKLLSPRRARPRVPRPKDHSHKTISKFSSVAKPTRSIILHSISHNVAHSCHS